MQARRAETTLSIKIKMTIKMEERDEAEEVEEIGTLGQSK